MIVLCLLSALRGYNRELMIVSSIVMTAGKCPRLRDNLPLDGNG